MQPTERQTATQILNEDPWMLLGNEQLLYHLIGNEKMQAKRKFKAAVKTVMATHIFTSLGPNLEEDLML